MTDVPSLKQTKTNFVFDFNDFMNLLFPLWFYSSVVDLLSLEKSPLKLKYNCLNNIKYDWDKIFIEYYF